MRGKANLTKWLLWTLFILVTWHLASSAHAKYGGGMGEPNDPYLIYTAEQMNTIGAEPNDWDKHFKLMADIDLEGYTGTGFNIIGMDGNPFTGVFDGNVHTISNFTYTSANSASIGIFAYIRGPKALIKNLGLIDPNIDTEIESLIGSVGSLAGTLSEGTITNCYVVGGKISGKRNVGGLVGSNNGLVTASYSRASVTGWNEVGGLVGGNSAYGEIVDCYAGGEVIGQSYVGGLVGNNATGSGRGGGLHSGTISNCYSTAVVSGDQLVGGLVGYSGDGGGISGSFWDIETSDQTISDGGVGKTTAEMQDPNTFINAGYAGWDFVGAPDGPSDIWAEPDGAGYPVLWWQLSSLPELPAFSGGTGEPDDPYLISTADELNSIGHNPRLMAAHFKLVDDIDLDDTNFLIISSPFYPFRGTFDGNGHTISNFSYIAANETYTGFFRYAAGAQIKNLGLIWPDVHVDRGDFHGCLIGYLDEGIIKNCYVEAGSVSGYDDYIGGLAGGNSGTVTNCYFTGDVYGHYTVGGLVGENSGTVTNCRSSCSVSGYDDYIGGLLGRNSDIVTNCYATGDVTGDVAVGGLVGYNGGSVMASYSYASVKGRTEVGGLLGRNSSGEAVNCYARGDVIGYRYVGGLVGSNVTPSGRTIGTIRNCHSATVVSGDEQVGGLVGRNGDSGVIGSFWDIETSGQTTSNGGIGKTTAEMQSADTFLDAGWDFVGEAQNGTEDIWWILEGQDYPRLSWEGVSGE